MNNYECLREICVNRKSVRKFSSKEVEREVIDKIIEIAKTSPFASNRKKWDIIPLTDRDIIKQMGLAVKAKVAEFEPMIRSDLRGEFLDYAENFYSFESAPLVFIPTFKISPSLSIMIKEEKNDILVWERDNYVKSISCSIMLLLLAAESLGLGACYMTGPLIAEKEIIKLLNINPARKIGALIPAGYKAGE